MKTLDDLLRSIRIYRTKKIILTIALILFLMPTTVNFISGDKEEFEDLVISDLNVKDNLECGKCHSQEQGKDFVLNMEDACYRCHNQKVGFLIPISSEVHKFHQGNPSVLPDLDYSARHKTPLSNNCETCHVFTDKNQDCRICHSGKHVDNARESCLTCHISLDDLFKHKVIELGKHDFLGERACFMCHSENRVFLTLANGVKMPVSKSSNLCKQCHISDYMEWENGNHGNNSYDCVICHNPHDPSGEGE